MDQNHGNIPSLRYSLFYSALKRDCFTDSFTWLATLVPGETSSAAITCEVQMRLERNMQNQGQADDNLETEGGVHIESM